MITARNGKAIYLVLADKIIDGILSGKLNADDRLLSIRDYAAEVQVNQNTVMRTYDYLSEQGLIYNRRGVGYFVAADARKKGESLRSRQLLGSELNKIFKQLYLLGISIEELAEKYRNFIETQKD